MAAKFLISSDGETVSDAILASDYAQSAGADVINSSRGGSASHAGTSTTVALSMTGNKLMRAYFRQTGSAWKQQHFNASELLLQVLERAAGVETVEVRFPMNGHRRGFMRFAYTKFQN